MNSSNLTKSNHGYSRNSPDAVAGSCKCLGMTTPAHNQKSDSLLILKKIQQEKSVRLLDVNITTRST